MASYWFLHPFPEGAEEIVIPFPPEREEEWAQVSEESRKYLERAEKAEARARELLLSKLTPEQKKTLDEHEYFDVRGSEGGMYRINCWHLTQNVDILVDGVPDRSICAGPFDSMPHSDYWLAQKLAIEADEKAFLAVGVPGFGQPRRRSAWRP